MSNSTLITQLRKKSLDMLRESTEMFDRAIRLLEWGKVKEAEEMKELARAKRTDSIMLIQEANSIDKNSLPPDKHHAAGSL